MDVTIDPMHKWLPIKNSFVSIEISPTNLVFEFIIQRKFYFQARLVAYKRIFIWQPFMHRVYKFVPVPLAYFVPSHFEIIVILLSRF